MDRQSLKTLHVARRRRKPRFDSVPLQLGLQGDPWKVMVASLLLNRTTAVQVRPVLRKLLERWPEPHDLAKADPRSVAAVIRPLGLKNVRSRLLVRMAKRWESDEWEHPSELPGVGPYALDAVAIFCFGVPSVESGDKVLVAYVEQLAA